MSLIRRLSLFVLLAIGALAIGACGGDDGDASAGDADPTATATERMDGDEGTTVAYTLADFEISGPDGAATGSIQFDATNTSSQIHELVVIRSDAATDSLTVDSAIVVEADLDIVGRVDQVPAGEAGSTTLDLEAGGYLLICNIPAHYELGMVVEFTVE